jgi:predicted  nucleic acid-binding Zn-ribbon protein
MHPKKVHFFILKKERKNKLNEDLLLLIELQECDSKLLAFSTRKKTLPEKIEKLDKDFATYKESMEQNKKKHEELKNAHADKEKEIKKINENIAKAKGRLLEVKNNKEYQAILKEIEVAEASCGDIETQIISLLDEMDNISSLVKKDNDILVQQSQKYEDERKILEADINSLDTDFFQWEQKRNEIKIKIDGGLLEKYEKIKNRNGGVGVVSVWKAVCNGCHMNIPPQLYNELQKSSELMICPNCNRIIYYQNKDNAAL